MKLIKPEDPHKVDKPEDPHKVDKPEDPHEVDKPEDPHEVQTMFQCLKTETGLFVFFNIISP